MSFVENNEEERTTFSTGSPSNNRSLNDNERELYSNSSFSRNQFCLQCLWYVDPEVKTLEYYSIITDHLVENYSKLVNALQETSPRET